jgi:hypothetical protein
MELTTNLNNVTKETEVLIHTGGILSIQFNGIFDGAIVGIRYSQNDLPLNNLSSLAISENDTLQATILKGIKYQLFITGETATTSITIGIKS